MGMNELTKHEAIFSGRRVAWEEYGSGKSVLLIHGFCGSSAYWSDIWSFLPATFRWIAFDLRGHGGSEPVRHEPSTMEQLAEDIAQFAHHLQLQEVVVCGHSLGGYATLALLERCPRWLKGIGLIHSTAYPDTESTKVARTVNVDLIRSSGIEPFVRTLIPRLFAPAYVDSNTEQVHKYMDVGFATDGEQAARLIEGMRDRPDRHYVLGTTRAPILLVAGEHDVILSEERVFSSLEGTNVVKKRIDGAGHMSMIEQPAQLAEVLCSFVTSIYA